MSAEDRNLSFGFPFGINDIRYVRKAVRYRLGLRKTPPAAATGLSIERRRELDEVADWILREPK